MKSVTYWYQFFIAREELVPILHDVKLSKCEIYGSTEPPWVGGTIFCSRHLGHMTKMAATPIYGKKH